MYKEYLQEKTARISITKVLPEDVFSEIFSKLDIKDLGQIASVCRKFNRIQKRPIIWDKIAALHNYIVIPEKDVKAQVREGKIDLEYGVVNLKDKCILLKNDFFIYKREIDIQDFYMQALSYFPKNYYINFYWYGLSYIYYKDSKICLLKPVYRRASGYDNEEIIKALQVNSKKITILIS